MVYLLMMIPEARIRCFHVNEDKSVAEQQAYIYEALPERLKNLPKRRGSPHSTVYTQANGFVGGKLILPAQPGYRRGSEMIFGTYSQYQTDPKCVEGWWAHCIWCDEEVPLKMYERLLTRIIDARGRLVLSFTTIQGWSPLVADILKKTKTLRRRKSDLLQREIPVAQESLSRRGTRIYYFWTQDNPFIPRETVENLRGRPMEEILSIAHGIPTKPTRSKFPRFDEAVHVIAHEKLPWLQPDCGVEFTRYHVIDPSGSKPWAMCWLAVDPAGKIYVYREWPDVGYGNWGEQGSTAEGKAGDAQKPNGWGINDYVELIKNCEEGEDIFERLIDPRLGAAPTQAKEGATSIITELEDAGLTYLPAPGLNVEHGLQLISSRLTYDNTQPITAMNAPKLYISNRCENTVECLKNYSGAGATEVWKDFIDCLRYALEQGCDFVAKNDEASRAPTFSY
jgi:phage terminase large subunit-like protein